MSTVPTTSKLVAGAITELFQSVSDGKSLVAAAITGKGVPTAAEDTFQVMSDNIGDIVLGSGSALPNDVRAGETFSNDLGPGQVGELVVRDAGGAVVVTAITADVTLQPGIYDLPITVKGDPDKVSANIRATAIIDGVAGKTEVVDTTTAAGATVAQILAPQEAFINGIKRIGTMPELGALDIIPGAAAVPIGAGHTTGGQVRAVAGLAANVIKKDAVVGGVLGSYVDGVIAGEAVIGSVNASKTTSSTIYVLLKSLRIKMNGIYRISFNFNANNAVGTNAWGRVYRNGVPYGIERISSANGFVAFNEDLFFNINDEVQLWAKATATNSFSNQSFEVKVIQCDTILS
jgi:hypothetical protein